MPERSSYFWYAPVCRHRRHQAVPSHAFECGRTPYNRERMPLDRAVCVLALAAVASGCAGSGAPRAWRPTSVVEWRAGMRNPVTLGPPTPRGWRRVLLVVQTAPGAWLVVAVSTSGEWACSGYGVDVSGRSNRAAAAALVDRMEWPWFRECTTCRYPDRYLVFDAQRGRVRDDDCWSADRALSIWRELIGGGVCPPTPPPAVGHGVD